MKIGLCGTGKMGSAIVQRLMSCGHEMTVWNRDATKTEPLVAAGAKRADTPAALAGAVEIVITMLLNVEALVAVYEGAGGLLSADLTGKLVIDMSTVLPATEEKYAGLVQARGAGFVDCPVGGTVGPAKEGKLLGLAGGTDADVARARPVLEQLCRRLEHVGPSGSGAKLKLAVNLPLLVYWQALGEALAIAGSLPIPAERLIDILADTSGANTAMKGRSADIAKGLTGAPPSPANFNVTGARKDLATMVDFASLVGVGAPVTAAALSGFDAAIAAGFGEADATQVAVYWAHRQAS